MSTQRIVHIDDNVTFRRTFAELISDKGYEVTSYHDSSHAEEELSERDFLAAIVDSSGFEFIRRLRLERPSCRCIALSSQRPSSSGIVDEVVLKSDRWRVDVLEILRKTVHVDSIMRRGSLDLFAEETERERLRGKIIVVGDVPERVLGEFDNESDVLAFLETSAYGCRIIQGPPLNEASLDDLKLRQ